MTFSYADKSLERLFRFRKLAPLSSCEEMRLNADLRVVAIESIESLVTLDSQTISCKKGDILILSKGLLFSFSGEGYFADFSGSAAVESLRELTRETFLRLSGFDSEPVVELFRRFLLMKELHSGEYSLSAYGFQMIVRIFAMIHGGKQQSHPPLITAALDLIEKQYPFLLGVDDVAQRLSVSKNHLVREFTRHMGLAPGQYLTYIRIENAKFLLLDHSMSLDFVATATGFSCANYFSKVFKKHTGQTAGQFIASNVQSKAGLDAHLFV